MKTIALLAVLAAAARAAAPAAPLKVAPADAKKSVGKDAVVCGVVASGAYLEKGKDAPTLLNLDAAYPKQVFTVVVYGKDRAKFGAPEKDLLKKTVCATGTITLFKDVPQIVVSDPKQLTVADAKPAAK